MSFDPLDGMSATVDVDLFKDVEQVGFDGVRTDAEFFGYHLIGIALGQDFQNFQLS